MQKWVLTSTMYMRCNACAAEQVHVCTFCSHQHLRSQQTKAHLSFQNHCRMLIHFDYLVNIAEMP